MTTRALWRTLAGSALIGSLVGLAAREPGAARPRAKAEKPDPEAAAAAVRAPGRGREAAAPIHIPFQGWRDIAWRTYEQISVDRVLAVAAGVTFYALLAIFPAVTALVSIYGLFADRTTAIEHLNLVAGVLPSGAVEIIGEQMTRIASQPAESLGFGFAFGLAVALWSANQGMKAMFDALNVAYSEREERSFVRLNLISLGFTLAGIAFVLAAIGAVVALPVALAYLGLSTLSNVLISLARWPLLILGLALVVSVLYRYGPSRRRARWAWITPGGILASGVWLAVSILFSWYVANFGAYNETYGSLGAAIGFMTWIWVSASIVLIGAELNAEIEHQTARDTTVGPDRPMGARGAAMADTLGRPVE